MASAASSIAEARRRAALSQEELAERAGTSRTAVCAYEAGAKDPRSETVGRLIVLLDSGWSWCQPSTGRPWTPGERRFHPSVPAAP